ncbi:MAG TPA: tripartite tricarboxylate transporter substrate-binding protein [Burkholderiales bacterium]|nr:tripartite tricarboxylate transporter substrate-binding protein [Burkholderiales bacterium]
MTTLPKAAMLAALYCSAAGAEYPDRPLRAIVPFNAGASNDTMARLVAPMLTKSLGQQVIVENRPGADGRIGIEALARAVPDGHTILFSGGAVALIPALRRNVPYDPVRDIQPVADLGVAPYAIAVHPQVPAKNVAELIGIARRNPGKLNGASGGNSTFMTLVLFQLKTGTRIVNIPYKGTGDAALAVVRGEADLAIMDTSAFLTHLSSGRIRVLAVAGDRRNPAVPDVPTTKEAGLADYTAGAVFSVFTTGKTPSDIVRRLNAEINRIVASPEVSKRLVALGMDPAPKTVEECTRQYFADLAKWKDVVARAGIPLEN